MFLKKIDAAVQFILRWICIALFAVLGALLFGNVLLRLSGDLEQFFRAKGVHDAANVIRAVLPITSFHWLDEIVELCFSALTFYGAAALWAIKGHFSVGDWISKRLPGDISRNIYKLIISLICLSFLVIFFAYSLNLVINSTELSTVFQIPKKLMYSSMPVSAFIMMAYAVSDSIIIIKGMARPLEHTDS
ncbi:MAG: TRAP transporter small permease subunit [Spirochaetaceae bacterium]|jgi:TRAP-type C4-dicarboxylate transport system permease small subunit|nr:TRAP transporter small permease subunit [Spirochaetaceae bacterium]